MKKMIVKCYNGHKALPLPDGKFLYGGSCVTPSVLDADIYIGLDSMVRVSELSYPWIKDKAEFLFKIRDGDPPSDLIQTKALLQYIYDCLQEGKKVHIGCLGGHGRTGTIMAALLAQNYGMKDSIKYIRENYCKKAVESPSQVSWLKDNFDVIPAKSSKLYERPYVYGSNVTRIAGKTGWESTGHPMSSQLCVWNKLLNL